jgi:hypothetical protein
MTPGGRGASRKIKLLGRLPGSALRELGVAALAGVFVIAGEARLIVLGRCALSAGGGFADRFGRFCAVGSSWVRPFRLMRHLRFLSAGTAG